MKSPVIDPNQIDREINVLAVLLEISRPLYEQIVRRFASSGLNDKEVQFMAYVVTINTRLEMLREYKTASEANEQGGEG